MRYLFLAQSGIGGGHPHARFSALFLSGVMCISLITGCNTNQNYRWSGATGVHQISSVTDFYPAIGDGTVHRMHEIAKTDSMDERAVRRLGEPVYFRDVAAAETPYQYITIVANCAFPRYLAEVTGNREVLVFAEVSPRSGEPMRRIIYQDSFQPESALLNFNGVVVYGPTKYTGGELKVTFYIFELDAEDNAVLSALAKGVADSASVLVAQGGPSSVLASEVVGKTLDALIAANIDDRELRFETTFLPLGPRDTVPRPGMNHLKTGSYALVKKEVGRRRADTAALVDFDYEWNFPLTPGSAGEPNPPIVFRSGQMFVHEEMEARFYDKLTIPKTKPAVGRGDSQRAEQRYILQLQEAETVVNDSARQQVLEQRRVPNPDPQSPPPPVPSRDQAKEISKKLDPLTDAVERAPIPTKPGEEAARRSLVDSLEDMSASLKETSSLDYQTIRKLEDLVDLVESKKPAGGLGQESIEPTSVSSAMATWSPAVEKASVEVAKAAHDTMIEAGKSIPARREQAGGARALDMVHYQPYTKKSYLTFSVYSHLEPADEDVLLALHEKHSADIDGLLQHPVSESGQTAVIEKIDALNASLVKAILVHEAEKSLKRVDPAKYGEAVPKLVAMYQGKAGMTSEELNELFTGVATHLKARGEMEELQIPTESEIHSVLAGMIGEERAQRLLAADPEKLGETLDRLLAQYPQLTAVMPSLRNWVNVLRLLRELDSANQPTGGGGQEN